MSLDIPEHPDKEPVFRRNEEEMILALMIDHPEIMLDMSRHFKPDLFQHIPVQIAVAEILNYQDTYGCWPTREVLIASLAHKLGPDDSQSYEILELVGKPSDPRNVPYIKDRLEQWVKSSIYNKIYDETIRQKVIAGDFDAINELVEEASRVNSISREGFWLFDKVYELFQFEEADHFTTGFSNLDRVLNDGGPERKDILIWMAPTNGGKSIALVNTAIANVLKKRKVLYITLEMSDRKTAQRMVGVMTELATGKIHTMLDNKKHILASMERHRNTYQTDGGDLVIYEFAPEEISPNDIYILCDDLARRHGWRPDVIVVDYLELLLSNRKSEDQEWLRQKAVSTQMRGLAKKTNTFVVSATQTNRSGNDAKTDIGIQNISESYGKAMALDYLVSIKMDEGNQESSERHLVYNVIKNRNGSNQVKGQLKVDFNTMKMKELYNA